MPGIPLLTTESQYAIYSAAKIYRGILRKIEACDYNPFLSRVFVPSIEKIKILLHEGLRTKVLSAQEKLFFDLFMEPAAGILDYWRWTGNRVPLQNYLAWFGLSFVFAIIGIKLGLFLQPSLPSKGLGSLPRIAFHFYFAQLVYFGLVNLKGL